MPKRAKSICRKIGCNELLDAPGYCEKHTKNNKPFWHQDVKKTTAAKRFYSSAPWTKKSSQHRKNQPLCQEHLQKGLIKGGEMVHHIIELKELLRRGLDPLDNKYLETLCNSCHLGHLRAKKK